MATVQQTPSDNKPRRRSSPWVVVFFVVLVSGPLIGPVFIVQFKKEIARWYWAAALNSHKEKKYDEALAKYESALKYDPGSPKLILDRALVHIHMKNEKQAIEDLDGLSDLGPGQKLAQARLYRMLKQRDKAAKALDSIEPYELTPQGTLERAQIYLESKQFAKALADVDRLLATDGLTKQFKSYLSQLRSSLLFSLGRKGESLAPLKQLVADVKKAVEEKKADNAKYANALNALAYQRSLANVEIAQGIIDVNKALRIGNKSARSAYLDTRGWLYFRAKKYEQALADLDEAVKLFRKQYAKQLSREKAPESIHRELAVMLKHRAYAYQATHRPEKYQADVKEISELGYDVKDPHLH